ncbi:MAG: amidohydrolase [Erysipelotrichales bacterium]
MELLMRYKRNEEFIMSIALINGKIHTMNSDEIVEAILIDNDKISMVGTTNNIMEYVSNKDEIIDLEGHVVIPGLNDSHLHALLTAQKMQQIDLCNARSTTDLINITQNNWPDDLKQGDWVIGRGWNQDYFDVKEFPTKDDLDKISTETPICLIRACIHICVVNSKALEIINLDKNNLPQLDDGKIYIDDNGDLNGLFSEGALGYVYSNLPILEVDDIKDLIVRFADHVNAQGITSVQSDDFTALPGVQYETIMKAYQELDTEGKLNLKVYQQCLLPKVDLLQDFINKSYHISEGFNNYRIGPLKLLLDGSLGARTAVLEGNYHDEDINGISIYNDEELFSLGNIAQNNNIQMAIHGIGDGAINQILDLYEKLEKENPKEDLRHGIVHCQITEAVALKRIRDINAVVYAQPIFLHYDIHMVEDRVGVEKARTSYAFKTLIEEGVSLSLGTDSPVESTSPFHNIYCAVARKDLSGNMIHSWNEKECLSVQQAVYAYTYEGAYQSFEENIKGSLEVGKQADLIVLNQDIFNIDFENINDTEVLKTMLDGKLIYSK